MEQNLPIMAKKAWSLMRAFFFILKKGISKAKFLADLNIIIKRGKLAGKALHNLLFHHHPSAVRRHLSFPITTTTSSPPPSSSDSEFSCTTTPPHPPPSPFPAKKLKHRRLATQDAPQAAADGGIGEMVKELRITDSPFPVNGGGDGGGEVDEAAEMFIMRVYNDLRRQD